MKRPLDSVTGRQLPKNAMIIRATEVSQFRNCRLNWWCHSHNGLNLEPKAQSPKLRFGTVWHEGLEWYYRDGKDANSFMAGLENGFAREEAKFKRILGVATYTEEIQQVFAEEKELAFLLMTSYINWSSQPSSFMGDSDGPEVSDKDFEVLDVEKRLVVRIPTSKGRPSMVWLAVKLDTIVEDKQGLWVMEHKTQAKSSKVNDPTNLPLDIQMTLQVWALRQWAKAQGITTPVQGALYNLTRKQAPSARVKNPIHGRHVVRRSAKEQENVLNSVYMDSIAMRACKREEGLRYINPQPWQGFCSWGCGVRSICIQKLRGEDYGFTAEETLRTRDKSIWEILREDMEE